MRHSWGYRLIPGKASRDPASINQRPSPGVRPTVGSRCRACGLEVGVSPEYAAYLEAAFGEGAYGDCAFIQAAQVMSS